MFLPKISREDWIGYLIGGGAGAVIGNQMDKKAAEEGKLQ